jgi:hypothetical protein
MHKFFHTNTIALSLALNINETHYLTVVVKKIFDTMSQLPLVKPSSLIHHLLGTWIAQRV